MKKYLLFKISAISILLLISFYHLSCDIKSPVENVNVIFNTLPVSTVISGTIVDAATGDPIQGKTINLTILGDNVNDVVTLTSTPQSNFSTNAGFIDFALRETAKPSVNSPVRFSIVAKCDGYLTNSLPIIIDKTGNTNFTLYMVSESNLPTGAVNASATGQADNSGTVQSDISVVAYESQANVTAAMYIPKGTVLMDANGNLLKGNITASLTYFNSQNDESLECLPGGYFVNTRKNNAVSQGVFLTAGFFNLKITGSNGIEAKVFKKKNQSKVSTEDTLNPLITVEMAQSTINPETGTAVKNGDTIDVWSFDESASTWNQEQNLLIKGPNENGNLFVQFHINHLSSWNLDWKGFACEVGITINIIGKPAGNHVRLVITGLYGNYHNSIDITDNTVTILRAPYNIRVKISAYDVTYCPHKIGVGSIIIDNLCASGPVNLNLNYTTPPAPVVNLSIYAEGFCNCNRNIIVRPNGMPIWYGIDASCSSNLSFAGIINNGSITIPGIQIGEKYKYLTWYEGEYYTIGATVFSDHAEIDPGLSSENIASSQVTVKGSNAILSFKGRLSNSVCKNICNPR
jgi:hypothetical protein